MRLKIEPILYSLTIGAVLLFQVLQLGNQPPIDADELYFEAVALNLYQQGTFGVRFNEDLIAPYRDWSNSRKSESSATCLGDLGRGGYQGLFNGRVIQEWQLIGIDGPVTTFRPPLYPFLLSIVYRFTGRSFKAMRILNVAFIALGIWIVLSFLAARFGRQSMIVAAILLAVDPTHQPFVRLGLSEALAFVLVSSVMVLAFGQQTERKVIGLALVSSLAALARTAFTLFLPFLVVLVFLKTEKGKRLRYVLIYTIIAVAVQGPWWARNSILLDRFEPLGSQSGIFLGAIYINDPLKNGANWSVEGHKRFINSFESDLKQIEREAAISAYGKLLARRYISENPGGFFRLGYERIRSFWWQHAALFQRVLLLLTVLALLYSREWQSLLLTFAIAQSVIIAVSGSSEPPPGALTGRFLFAIHPLLIASASIALAESARHLRIITKKNVGVCTW